MFLYSVAFKLYILMVYLASVFNPKAKKLIVGRRNFFKLHHPDPKVSFIWFHCASLGEFEQARPLIERIKKDRPSKKILLSFFSSSGYEIQKNYGLADQVIYLPFDSESNAKKFFQTFNISLAIFVKYDVWPFYLKELLRLGIPVFLTSAVFRNNQLYFKWYGRFLRDLLKKMNLIFVQNADSLKLSKKFGFENVQECGDVRVDRVMQIHQEDQKLPEVEQFKSDSHIIIFGSVYPSDIGIIQSMILNKGFKFIIAPHKTDSATINFFQQKFPGSILFSNMENYSNQNILVVDHVGSLNKIYKYGVAAYIGGGFEKGIHNILEPAVWGIPVYFGPMFHKFPEANSLVHQKIAFSRKNRVELSKIMGSNTKEFDPAKFKKMSESWFHAHSGSTNLIYSRLDNFI